MSTPEVTIVKPAASTCSGACAEDALVVRNEDIDAIVKRIGTERHHVVHILHEIQNLYRYLPQDALKRVCEVSDVSPAQITEVSTFFKRFRHKPVGKHIVRVCVGTACHVNGAERIHESFCDELGIKDGAGKDSVTDESGTFTVEKVACVGCCTLAPVVQGEQGMYGPLATDDASTVLRDVAAREPSEGEDDEGFAPSGKDHVFDGQVRIALDSCCVARGADKVAHAMRAVIRRAHLNVDVRSVGCLGMSCQSPLVEIVVGDKTTRYGSVEPHDAERVLFRHFRAANVFKRLGFAMSGVVDKMLTDMYWDPIETRRLKERSETSAAFFGPQVRVATEHCGVMDPLDMDEYRARDGFKALEMACTALDRDAIITCITDSGLRGRGGAGFPTGMKWKFVKDVEADQKYVICNGDEGDPGAFMDRMLLESYPFRVIEGLAVAARAVGASKGYLYIREEYPLAIKRVEQALEVCREHGILGEGIFGSDFALDLEIIRGAGAFICGEETAMIASIEGDRGTPAARPPYPAQHGLWGKPTCINNVESLSCISWIMRNGPEAFAQYGTASSKGTKVFALAGKVRRGGMIEVALGTTIRQIVEDIGGGALEGRKIKAIQIGGPSGGCIPERLFDTPIDYEALKDLGAIMGSGGMVVMDDTDCMVDIARYFLEFASAESCGQCSVGRLGTTRLLEILERLCAGKGKKADLKELESLGKVVLHGSFCALCGTAPNPVLTTLKYFREEYEAHIEGKCPGGKCKELIKYEIESNCIGCTRCAQYCPTDAIPMTPFRKHDIIQDRCTKCDMCFQVCPEGAIYIR